MRSAGKAVVPGATADALDALGLSDFVALDLETTGLDPQAHQPIEIGLVRFRAGVPVEEFRSFVAAAGPLDPFITELTGITNADLDGAPSFTEIAPDVLTFIGDRPLAGQNVDFDLGFLRAAGERWIGRARDNPFGYANARAVDAALIARVFWPEWPGFSLRSLSEAFAVSIARAHRALDDARAVGQVLVGMVERLPSRVWSNLASDLHRLIGPTRHRSRFFFAALVELARGIRKPERENVPRDEETRGDELQAPDLSELLGAGGLFEERLPFFEYRTAQAVMASSAERAFEDGTVLLTEAPTGVGKSLAYLVPALRWALSDREAGRQVIVSSHTKVLQEQLCRKDIGEIRRAVNEGFRAAVLKGRANYLCRRRLKYVLREADERLSDQDRVNLLPLLRWAELTETGDISEISGFNPKYYPHLWAQVASDPLTCSGAACSAAKGDFYRAAQDRAVKAQVVFVNHALLASDPARFIGGERRLVLDEAHQVERAVVGAMTTEISAGAMRSLLSRLVDERASRGLLPSVLGRVSDRLETVAEEKAVELPGKVRALFTSVRDSFFGLGERLVGMLSETERSGRLRFRFGQQLHADIARTLGPLLIEWMDFSNGLQDLLRALADLRGDDRPAPELLVELRSAVEGVAGLGERLDRMLREESANTVTWVEFGRGGYGSWCALYAAPISVGDLLRQSFWPVAQGAVLTSATMTAGGTFDTLKESLGLDSLGSAKLSEEVLDSPFHLPEQMRCLVPVYLPDPRQNDAAHAQAFTDLAVQVVERFARGTLILCTSNDLVERVTNALTPVSRSRNRCLLSQRLSSSLPELLEEFRGRRDAILVGAASFWEGIDVVGEALQILLVSRIPFDVPTDPWIAARCERLQNEGRDPFAEYSLPVAALRLKQGVGRLIRHPEDRGVAILGDPRLFTSRYGSVIRDSLPVPSQALMSDRDLFVEMKRFFGDS